MDAPPTRYKVVERGRRLVVLDSWNGNAPVTDKAAIPDEAARPATVEQARAALHPARRARAASRPVPGGMDTQPLVVTTQSWFDDKAPRRIAVDAPAQSKLAILLVIGLPVIVLVFVMFGWLVAPVACFLLLQPSVRKGMRGALTPVLDGLEVAG